MKKKAPIKPIKKPIISIRNLTKSYGKNTVLKGVNLDIYRNDRLAIVGVNGGGKTTLMEIVVGLTPKTSGEIEYFFKDNNSLSESIGMQFQDSNAPTGLTINDILKFIVKAYRKPISKQELDIFINTFNLKHLLKIQINKLSGGQKQRLNLLLSMIHKPELFIFDEVATGLDIKGKNDLINEIITLQKKLKSTLVIVSHNPEEIELLSDRVVVLKDGKVGMDLTTEEVVRKWGKVSTFLLKNVN